MYTGGIYVIKLLFLFLLLICLLLHGCLSQEPRRVEENHFFSLIPNIQISRSIIESEELHIKQLPLLVVAATI